MDYAEFSRQASTRRRFSMAWADRRLELDDKTSRTVYDRHYVYHPAWAARVLAETKPLEHIDISSTIHFCATVSAFVPIRFYDLRPAVIELSNLSSGKASLLALPFDSASVPSISCMHTIEHIGLGRYGDPVDYDGDLKAINELKRVVAKRGNLLLVVPVGRPRIQFNAHRIYSYGQITELFSDFVLREFSLIPEHEDSGGLLRNAAPALADAERYGCGCFWFTKPG